MRFPQVSIASLFGFIALIAVDCAWYRANYINGQSVFQFGDAPAFDTGVVPIANVAAIGLYMIVVTRAEPDLGSLVSCWVRLHLSSRFCSWAGDGPTASASGFARSIWCGDAGPRTLCQSPIYIWPTRLASCLCNCSSLRSLDSWLRASGEGDAVLHQPENRRSTRHD